jgi:hypothetical protein
LGACGRKNAYKGYELHTEPESGNIKGLGHLRGTGVESIKFTK